MSTLSVEGEPVNLDLLAWYLFMKMDSIPVGKLTPPLLRDILSEYDGLPVDTIAARLADEFNEKDLPPSIREAVPDTVTWKCHVCGVSRPDSRIGIFRRDISEQFHQPQGTVFCNVRHCNDNSDCILGAKKVRFFKETEKE